MTNENTEEKVLNFPTPKPAKAKRENDVKFGKAVMDYGYSMVPAILARAQQRIGLSPTQFAIIIQLLDYWWYNQNPPRPSQKKLAERLGISVRQLQRHLGELEKAGLITVERRHHPGHNGNQPNCYRLDGLVKRLKELEPEFTKQKKANIKAKQGLELPVYKRPTPKIRRVKR